jgi:TMEM151 family
MTKKYPKKPTAQDIYIELQQSNLPKHLKRSFIIHGLIFNIAVWLTLVYCLIVGEEAFSILIFVYISYFVESLFAPTLRYLWNLNQVEDIVSYIERLKTYPPEISFHCECYHYETRTRWVTECYTEYEEVYEEVYNSNLQRYERRSVRRPVQKYRQVEQTYEEKVVTYQETENFSFSRFEDVSGSVSDDIYQFQATKVDFSKSWQAGDEATSNAYQLKKINFQTRNQNRDRNFDFSEYFDLNNFKTKALSIVDLEKKSIFMHWLIYMFCSIFTFSWFYRKWLEAETVKGNFEFRKVIYLDSPY